MACCAAHRLVPAPSAGSRRRRVWDMEHTCHCPLVGVSLPMDSLRRLVHKALGAKVVADDYEVHAGAVSECGRRCKLSELLQAELDTRYVREITAFRGCKSAMAVAQLWRQYLQAGDVAGAFWAALSHPRCDAPVQESMCRDLHMFQHQAGAGVRLEIAKFHALAQENAILTRELAKVQERSTRLIAEKVADLEATHTQLVQARGQLITRDTRIACLTQDLDALRASVQDLESVERLQKRVQQMAERQASLDAANAQLRAQLALAQAPTPERRDTPGASPVVAKPPTDVVRPVHLHHKMVLCVGGRSGNVANYREVIERVGGRFTHHDGGREDNSAVLDASLAAADLVICQTGCISHNAYWRVKDFCKRTGKQCVFVENPSASSLVRGIEQACSQLP